MTSLFISYSRKDIESARKLTEAFKGQDLDFWIDWEGIPPTVDWWNEIEKGIEEAAIFLFLISPDSAKSPVCKREIEHAVKNGKRLIPVVVRDIKADESPSELGHLNWIFLRDNDDFNSAFSKLITAIKTDFEWVQTHRQLQVKALEWERGNYENSFLLRGKELQDAERELAKNSSKEPSPTDLQREYALKSRQVSDRQRRITTTIALAGVIALAMLAVYGFVQAGLATQNATEANKQAATAQAASTLAVTNQNLAEERAKIARSRELAAIAINQLNIDQDRSVLISLSANEEYHTLEANDALRRALLANQAHSVLGRCPAPPNFPSDDKILFTLIGFSYDSSKAAISCNNSPKKIHILDMATGKTIGEIPISDDTQFVYGFEFSADETTIAYTARGQGGGDMQGVAKVWEIASGKQIFVSPDYGLGSILSKDGARLWFFHPDNDGNGSFVYVYDVKNQKKIEEIPTSYLGMSKLGENQVVLGPSEDSAFIYNLSDMSKTAFKINSDQFVVQLNSSTITTDGLIGVKNNETISLINTTDNSQVASFSITGDVASSIAVSPDLTLAAYIRGNQIEIRNLQNPETIRTLSGHQSPIGHVEFSQDSKILISSSLDTTCRIWNVRTGELISTINKVLTCGFTPDRKNLILHTEDGSFILWDAENSGEVKSMDLGTPLKQAWFSKDSTTIFVVTETDEMVSWRWQDFQANAVILGNVDNQNITLPIKKATLSADAHIRIEVNDANEMLVWGQDKNQLFLKMRVTTDRVNDIQFSPDSTKLALAFGSQFIPSVIADAGWAPIPTRGELDHTVGIWDLNTMEKTAILRGFTNSVTSVNFSPDSKYVVTTSSDGVVRIFVVNTDDLMTLAKQRITRIPPELTCDERVQFLAELLDCPVVIQDPSQEP